MGLRLPCTVTRKNLCPCMFLNHYCRHAGDESEIKRVTNEAVTSHMFVAFRHSQSLL